MHSPCIVINTVCTPPRAAHILERLCAAGMLWAATGQHAKHTGGSGRGRLSQLSMAQAGPGAPGQAVRSPQGDLSPHLVEGDHAPAFPHPRCDALRCNDAGPAPVNYASLIFPQGCDRGPICRQKLHQRQEEGSRSRACPAAARFACCMLHARPSGCVHAGLLTPLSDPSQQWGRLSLLLAGNPDPQVP